MLIHAAARGGGSRGIERHRSGSSTHGAAHGAEPILSPTIMIFEDSDHVPLAPVRGSGFRAKPARVNRLEIREQEP